MNRVRFAFALLACVLMTLGVPAAAQPVDQAAWTSLKKEVRLQNGIRMTYVEAGNPSGEPLLLLHGYTDSSRAFSPMVPYLSRYRLLIPDQRGHGASDAPECCYGTSQFAYDARLFLDALGVKRVAVAGHSLGVGPVLRPGRPDLGQRPPAAQPIERGDRRWDHWHRPDVAALGRLLARARGRSDREIAPDPHDLTLEVEVVPAQRAELA